MNFNLFRNKNAVLLICIAICISISGYFYVNPDVITEWDGTYLARNHRREGTVKRYTYTDNYDKLKKSLVIEGVGLFLLLG